MMNPAFIALLLYSAVPAASSFAQQNPSTLPRPIDQGFEDRGPLSASLRNVEVGFGQPIQFQDLYRVPGRDDVLMRKDSGLTAIFPASVYAAEANSGQRPVPLIPAGTVFHIGTPYQPTKRLARPQPTQFMADRSRVQTGLDAGVDHEVREQSQWTIDDAGVWQNISTSPRIEPRQFILDDGRRSGPPIVNDDVYRANRIAGLLRRAADAHGQAQ